MYWRQHKTFSFHDTGKVTHMFLYITSPSCMSKVFWNTQFPTALLPYIVSFLQTPLFSDYLTTSKGFQIDQGNLGKTYIYIRKNPFDIFLLLFTSIYIPSNYHMVCISDDLARKLQAIMNKNTWKIYSFHAFVLCCRIKLFDFQDLLI